MREEIIWGSHETAQASMYGTVTDQVPHFGFETHLKSTTELGLRPCLPEAAPN